MVGHSSGLHSELRKVSESEVQFATPVRRMVNHSCVERDFIVVVLFLLFLFFFFFRFICQVVYLGQKSREKKRRSHGTNFNPSSRDICQL